MGEEVFGESHEAVEVEVGLLGLDHPELGEVAAGFGFFGAEGGAEAVDLAERERGGLDVELAGLREVGHLFIEVLHLEEVGGAFAGVGCEDGRVGADESIDIKVFCSSPHDGCSNAEDGGLARGAEPEVAVLHEEVDAVLFARDGVRRFFGDALGDGDVLHVELDAAEGARESSRTVPVTVSEDSRVRDLRVSKTCSGTAALGTMPWTVPVPSRKVGKSSLPELRRL